jgi:hypothetical protein
MAKAGPQLPVALMRFGLVLAGFQKGTAVILFKIRVVARSGTTALMSRDVAAT